MYRLAALLLIALLPLGCSSAPKEGDPNDPALTKEGEGAEQLTASEQASQDLCKKISQAVAKGQLTGAETLKIDRITVAAPRGAFDARALRTTLEQDLTALGMQLSEEPSADLVLRGKVGMSKVQSDAGSHTTWTVSLNVFSSAPARRVTGSVTQIRELDSR